MDAIIGAVNAGYDTDTVATMAGAMAGALSGSAAFPEHFLPTMEKSMDLRSVKRQTMSSGLQVSDRNGVSRMYDKILGCLLGAATGDAMGAATEAKSTGQIKEIFGGRVESFRNRQETYRREDESRVR